LKIAIEIVDFPIENGGSFHSYVSLPEGNWTSVDQVLASKNGNKKRRLTTPRVPFFTMISP
jgi:hypothetical protein